LFDFDAVLRDILRTVLNISLTDQASYSSKIAYVRLAEIAYEQF